MKKRVQDKKDLSPPRLDAKRTFYKQWLIFSKTQPLTQNGVRPTKLYFQHKIMKNTVEDKKPLSQPRVNAKLIFYKK